MMLDSIEHRGPDADGLWHSRDKRCVLGHRRLSIIDLSDAATQPMVNEDQSIAIVFNGEIYNHRELRQQLIAEGVQGWRTDHSDTEVILRAYEHWGLEAIQRFNGMFAIAIYDCRQQDAPVLHLVRDRVGIKPLYVTQTSSGEWVFASEIKAIIEHPDVRAEVSPAALWHYLTFVVTPAPMTMFKGVWKLPAGYHITIDPRGDAKATQWWDCKPSSESIYSESDLSFEAAEAELLRLLRQSISRRMVADVPFGVLLSGGVDSSLNVALMSEQMDRPVSTFTVGYEGYDQLNEFQYARQVVNQFGTNHHEMLIKPQDVLGFLDNMAWVQDEPIADNVCVPLYFLSKLVKDSDTTVIQVGEGADENFLGYWWCQHYLEKYQTVYRQGQVSRSMSMRLKQWLRNRRGIQVNDEDAFILQKAKQEQALFWGGAVSWWGRMRDQLTPDAGRFKETLNCPISGLLPSGFDSKDSYQVVSSYLQDMDVPEPQVLYHIPYMEHKLRLPEHLLMRVDKMTMAHSIEARVPFLDHDVVEFAMRLPASYKLHDSVGKCLVKKVAERYFDHDFIYRKKQGFGSPVEHWMKSKEFGGFVADTIMSSFLVRDGYVDQTYVASLLKRETSAQGGGYSSQIWTLLNVALWGKQWL